MNYRIDLAVLSEQKNNCRLGLTVHNLSDLDVTDWSLHFAFDRFILPESLSQGELTQVGSFCSFKPSSSVLKANNHYYLEFSIQSAPFRFYSDGLNDAFIQSNSKGEASVLPVAISPIVLASPYSERSQLPAVSASRLALIPRPNKLKVDQGHFELNSNCKVEIKSHLADNAVTWLEQELLSTFDLSLTTKNSGNILFRNNPTLDEAKYKLNITSQHINIESGSQSGFIHAVASLIQLVEPSSNTRFSLPCCQIVDEPRFKYRGMMLDCARHFHSVDQVKRLINQLAHYKFNVFHWHLTDDEGWRIEIKSLPQLTEVGAWRGPNHALEPQYTHIAENYGGFYTQQQIREVIEYAEQRSITVIPEIDIPGHCRAAIKSLPDMLVEQADTTQYKSIQHYNDNVLNPGLPGTYQFLDAVIEEVAELFPSELIHMGADEVPPGVWTNSPAAQALMKEHQYQDSKDLQGHLFRYAESKLKQLGKRMVGWEEAQHGDKVSKETIIYSWLSEEAAVNCARQGFDVVLQPAQFTYLDMTQDYAPEEPGVDWAAVIPLEQAYTYEALAEISDTDPIRKRICGIQCALWCEVITNQQRMDYMVFPRISALAEGCWTHKNNREWLDYLSRLKGHLPLLDRLNVDYRNPWKAE
ncbi:beta-N-acetylhexosaminidase [Vibrio toranzoniae]|uniref:beta-N-acetylhexosaminidase n=1 Tax=Vibrio toranzoniae TaxID=1194427 RepID=A0A125P593_9VIBR|nr:family 20 glycosylhydrolase [Vibrio toranzoniae]KWU00576.1 beta-hexosaminidase [Vibrio toranzoniae]NAZ96624.1 family 20 glycosylhydrolase [Vibrio toranzoniae]SBS35965.1 Beta-hexosaminidase [Vibrio toranzoniae]